MNNSPAFPHVNPSFDDNWNKERQVEGMSLRDYFAAAILPSLYTLHWIDFRPTDLAERAYKMADAMLAAREQ